MDRMVEHAKAAKSHSTRLKGLDLARNILCQLKNNDFDIDAIKTYYYDDGKFVMSIVEFLKQVDWISQDGDGKYRLTLEGHKNCLENLRF